MRNNSCVLSLLLPILLLSFLFILTACGASDSSTGQSGQQNTNSSSLISFAPTSQSSSKSSSLMASQSSNNSIGLPVSSSQSSSSRSSLSSVSSSSKSSVSSIVPLSSSSSMTSSSSSKSSVGSSSTSSASSSTTSSQASSQASSQTTGCGKTFSTGDIKNLTVKDGAARDRSFDINVSPDYANNMGASVIFNFHGNGGTSEGSAAAGFQYAVAEMHDQAISVFPQGIWWENFGVGWEESCKGYDMVFFDNILKYLNENYCINTDRIFVSGFSWGGDMTNALACCRGEKIKSIAPVSGPERVNSSCPTNKWPVTWMRYGTNDGAYPQNMFESTRQFYIQKLGCLTNSTLLTGDAQCSVYSGCATPLTVCARPIGHTPLSYPEIQQLWQYWRSLP